MNFNKVKLTWMEAATVQQQATVGSTLDLLTDGVSTFRCYWTDRSFLPFKIKRGVAQLQTTLTCSVKRYVRSYMKKSQKMIKDAGSTSPTHIQVLIVAACYQFNSPLTK